MRCKLLFNLNDEDDRRRFTQSIKSQDYLLALWAISTSLDEERKLSNTDFYAILEKYDINLEDLN